MPTATYTVSVDWDKNGNYTGTYDDITSYVRSIRSFNGFRQPFMNVAGEATLELELDNADKRFSPEYSGGPLYGKKWINLPVRFRADNGTTYTMWLGTVTSVHPQPGANGEKRAILRARGPKLILDTSKIYLPLQIGQRTDQIISNILGQVVFAEANSVGPWALGLVGYSEVDTATYVGQSALVNALETNGITISYFGDTWENGVTAYEAIKQVVEAERGKFFFDRFGQAVFYTRTHFPLVTTDLATLTDASILSYAYIYGGEDDIVNKVIVKYQPRSIGGATDTLWALDKPVNISGGTESRIQARFTEQNSDSKISGYNVLIPQIANSTLQFSSGTAELVTWTVDSRGAEMVFVARNGNCTISEIIIQGYKLTAYNAAEAIAVDDSSPFFYGPHELALNIPAIDNANDAQSIADYEALRRPTPAGRMASISLINKSTAILAQQLARTIGDRINLSETQTAHNADYFIIGEEHVITDGMKKHITTWYLEPANAAQFWVLGVAGFSEVGQTTRVGPL